jgi:hypothetical protein
MKYDEYKLANPWDDQEVHEVDEDDHHEEQEELKE